MKTMKLLLVAMFLGCFATAAPAQEATKLTIRLIEASDTYESKGKGLEDIIGLLQASFKFKYFHLLTSAAMPLPAKKSAPLGPYTVECQGPQDKLKIKVKLGKKTLVNTSVKLRDGKPFVMGGFKSKHGNAALVFMAN